MRRHATALLAAVVVLTAPGPGLANSGITNLRVFAVSRSTFDYKLMSAMGSGPTLRLVFNHRSGSTHIVRPGDPLGEFVVRSYEPIVERVFNPTINAYQEKKSGKAVLESGDGERVELTMGDALPGDGWTACLVDLSSGQWDHVRRGDTFDGEPVVDVLAVTTNRVRVRLGDREQPVTWASDEERTQVADLWEVRRKAYLARQRAAQSALEQAEQADAAAPGVIGPRPTLSSRLSSRPRSAFGTEYSYPTEFEVIPVLSRTPDGRIVNRTLVVPTRFERRSAGVFFGNPRIRTGGAHP